jgi:hypothetical protein
MAMVKIFMWRCRNNEPRRVVVVDIWITLPGSKLFPAMRPSLVSLVVASACLLAAGCINSTPQSRISKNREAYRSFPYDAQRKISEGQVDVGFTEKMVTLALGKPGKKLTHSGPEGDSEVWVYYKHQPHGSVSFGVGSGGYSGVSTGISLTTGSNPEDEYMRVIFSDGTVTSIETRTR